ncbi:MAG: hypothetical protein LIP12_06125 [Clostridiales bacterium]|nr:hypothetical protein [Clostridiales bacterium]
MANKNEYIGEAWETLMALSADERKRLEYEAREKAIRDHKAAMSYARKEGEAKGMEIGIEKGIAKGIEQGIAKGIEQGIEQGANRILRIIKMHKEGAPNAEIAEACETSVEEVERVLAEVF